MPSSVFDCCCAALLERSTAIAAFSSTYMAHVYTCSASVTGLYMTILL